MENTFCFCGRVGTRKIKNTWFCDKHDKVPVKRIKVGKYSGQSKSEFRFMDEELKKHSCEKWLEEARGCSICSKIGVMTKEEIKDIQEHINWHITSLQSALAEKDTEIERLKAELENHKNEYEYISKLQATIEEKDKRIEELYHHEAENFTMKKRIAKLEEDIASYIDDSFSY